MPSFPVTTNQGFFSQALDIPFFDITPQGSSAQLGSMFTPSMSGARAQKFMVPNPQTGKATWFGPLGQPVLFSGDFTASKRVARVARKARRSRGKR